MKGKVLDFSISENQGLISGDDGNRYTFIGKEWKSPTHPQAGGRVDFDAENKTAVGVYVDGPVQSATSSASGGDKQLDARYNSLYCSKDEKVIFGLCGGLAHKFGVPPAAMRVVTLVLLCCFGIGLLYIVGIFLPKLPTKGVPRPG